MLTILWNPDLTAFSVFGFDVRWYSLCWCIGLLMAYVIAARLYKQQKLGEDKFEPLFLYCFVGILAGARIGHCLFYQPEYFLSHPLEIILPFHQTETGWRFVGYEGLASHGGTLGLMIGLWLYVRKTKVNIMRVLDNIAIVTPITACFIRLGNLMNSEIVGKPTDAAWGFVFAHNGETFARHPGQLYEAIAYFIFFWVGLLLYRFHKQKVGTGFFFGFCLTAIFTFRFFVEHYKEVQVGFESSLPINMGQILSIPFILLGVYCLAGGKLCKTLGEKKK